MGNFPTTGEAGSGGKENFPMNHEWHIPIFPMKGFAGVVKNNFPMSGEATNGEKKFPHESRKAHYIFPMNGLVGIVKINPRMGKFLFTMTAKP